MSDTTLIPPSEERLPTPPTAEHPWREVYATLPPDVTLRPDAITLKHNVFVGSVAAMVLTSLVIFYIPFFNGLLAGSLGGFHAGRMKRALGAAVVSSVMVPAILAFASFMSEQPSLRFLSGLSFGGWIALNVIGTFIGAVGGAASRPKVSERELYLHS